MSRKKIPREVAVIDFETDPFKFGRVPAPFACGVLWRDVYVSFWGADCGTRACDYLLSIQVPLVIYAHNGGKFDFFFLWRYLENPIRLINARIVSARFGIHEFRDSWAIMPFALATYKKTVIDYEKFEVEVRDTHRAEIESYLFDDCKDLKALCDAFVKRFGFKLTIAGAGMKALNDFHPQEPCNESHDTRYREFYYGGRVECFESGIIEGRFKVFDVNSMYSEAMRNHDHPIGSEYVRVLLPGLDKDGWIDGYPGCMYFAKVEGRNFGGLPARVEERGMNHGSLSFTQAAGVFNTTSHELRAAIKLGRFRVERVLECFIPCAVQRFETFVDTFSREKAEFKAAGDMTNYWITKYTLNAPYGKFGQNPESFEDSMIVIVGQDSDPDEPWQLKHDGEQYRIWTKPSPQKRYYDVAIAASITSAARAILMHGIVNAKRPVYCDTDSIICEDLIGVRLHSSELGAWDCETTGTHMAIAGKKLYALYDSALQSPVKWASKGTKLPPHEIVKIASGGAVEWKSEAPNFKLGGKVKFVARTSRKTV